MVNLSEFREENSSKITMEENKTDGKVDSNDQVETCQVKTVGNGEKVLNHLFHLPTYVRDSLLYVPRYFGYFNSEIDPISLINDLDTFDIILCNGQNYWFSSVIEYATWSKFSHIGIVLKSPTWLHPELTGNYFLESGVEKFSDAVDHKMKFGVQITNLNKMINNYIGTLYVRKLKSEPYKTNPYYYENKLKGVYEMIRDKPYDENPIDLIQAQMRIKLHDNHDESFFCSALVAFIYVQLGFLPVDIDWHLVVPKDFASGYNMEKLMLDKGLGSLENMERIK